MVNDAAMLVRVSLQGGGYCPIPVTGKLPAMMAWQKHVETNAAEIALWGKLYPDAVNTGILCAHNPTIDIDLLNSEAAEAIEELVREWFEPRGRVLVRIGRPPKRAIVLRTSAPFRKIVRNVVAGNGTAEKLEVLADGQQVVVFGIHPETRHPYLWHGGEPGTVRCEELPLVRAEELAAFLDEAVALLVRDHGYSVPKANGQGAHAPDNGKLSQDWGALVGNIVAGAELHDSEAALALKLVNAGMSGGAAVNLLRALHNASLAPHDERFQARFADIPRAVASAERKVVRPERGNGGEAPPRRYVAHDRIAEDPTMLIEWLAENVLPRVAVAILSGHPGVGKTHIVNDLMCSVATGMPFAGHTVARTCGAVLFAAEGAETASMRWQTLRAAKTGPWFESQGLPANTAFPVDSTGSVPYLNEDDAYEQYDEALTEVAALQAARMAAAGIEYGGLGLVCIDTYNAALSFHDEEHNRVGPNQSIFNMLRRLAQKHHCCIVVVDHLGKDQSRGPLGTIAKTASCDVDLRITGTVAEDGSVSHTAMAIHKLRAGAQGKRIPFELKTVSNGADAGVTIHWDTHGIGMHVPKQNKRHRQLMKALDEALLQQWQWVRLGDNANYKAADSKLVRDTFKLSYPATAEEGERRDEAIKKAYNRAMRDSSIAGVIGSKTLADKTVVIWRTDYKVGDSSKLSEVSGTP